MVPPRPPHRPSPGLVSCPPTCSPRCGWRPLLKCRYDRGFTLHKHLQWFSLILRQNLSLVAPESLPGPRKSAQWASPLPPATPPGGSGLTSPSLLLPQDCPPLSQTLAHHHLLRGALLSLSLGLAPLLFTVTESCSFPLWYFLQLGMRH